MARLEDLARGAAVKGILPDSLVTVVDVKWHGSAVVELTYKDASGRLGNELLYRDREPTLEIASAGRSWSFDADGGLFRLVSEAHRIRLAYLFDPLLAVHTSLVDPLPHQITAVYGEMLMRQPLRFLLADDPGAGKTIVTGLLLKEWLIRGDLHRCLICCPGSLVEQWQDELYRRFHLPFDIMTREMMETARSGNAFAEHNLLVCRLDQLSRNEDLQAKLALTDWDVVVCDEAHKMSASFFSGEIKPTKRYKLGQLLGRLSRHFLLLTATPHNGKEEDFQLFMALLDADRFEGRFRDGVHAVDTSDLMRRMVKEQLLKFDGTPLFPERHAYTVNYLLSDLEARLYQEVTAYVREEMNRADRLSAEGEGRRGNMVGFALTILQRRLASSPEAIYQSLKRRRERLEKRLREEKLLKRGVDAQVDTTEGLALPLDEDGMDEFYDETPAAEVEQTEEEVVDRASAARTIAELEAELAILHRLEALALQVRRSGTDKKWEELSGLLQGKSNADAVAEIFDTQGHHRAEQLKAQESAGKPLAKRNSALARQRADELEGRLRQRMKELEQERHLSPLPPVVIGGALIVPQCLRGRSQTPVSEEVSQAERERIDRLAAAPVLETERKLGREPREMPHKHPGYDIESKDPAATRLRFIEVKGKAIGATTVTVSKTQILTALNKPDDFILAIVEVDGDTAREPRYIRRPFQREPDFGVTSVNYNLDELLARGEKPS